MAWDFKARPELWSGISMDLYYFDSPHKQITESFKARIVKVHDGDTVTVRTDFRDFDFPVRMIGIDARELNAQGHSARDWLESIVLNQNVDILVDPNERVGKWGRILGQIIHQGINLNELAVIEGMAVPFDQRNELANRAEEKSLTF